MGLENTKTVDAVVGNPTTGGIDLVLFDDGSVTDEVRRYDLVLSKLISYLEFFAGGQLAEQFPEHAGKAVRCCVVCKRRPNDAMLRIEGVKDRHDANKRLPVIVVAQEEYLKLTGAADPGQVPQKPWWRFW
jgi:hypothetical protein